LLYRFLYFLNYGLKLYPQYLPYTSAWILISALCTDKIEIYNSKFQLYL